MLILKYFIFNSILQLGMGEKSAEQLNNVWFAGSRIKILLLNTSLIIARMFIRRDNLASFMLLL